MTMAAGFLCNDGVLLCADTEHTGWAAKSHHSKVEHFEVSGGKVCFALSGASALAWSAIQKCRRQLQATPSNDLLTDVETILDAEYRRNVLGHPNYTSFDYSLLIGIWTPDERPQLYFTTATAITEVKDFQCIGIGGELASYLIRPGFNGLTLKSATALAAYTLGSVKDSISGCGGMSIYVLLRNDGAIGVLTSEHDGATKEVEKYAKVFDFQIKRLLLWMADLQGEDIHFERNVSNLMVQPIKDKHSEWVQAYKKKERQFAAVNPHLQPDEVKQMFADISMGFVPSGSSTKGPST
jgi:20S proteasome alpha/beta subunit